MARLEKRRVRGSVVSRLGLLDGIDIYQRQRPSGYNFGTTSKVMDSDKLLMELLRSHNEQYKTMSESLVKISSILEKLSLNQSKFGSRIVPYPV